MLSIANNIMASNAARYLGKAYSSLSESVERLSSGLRINGAKDDPAGLAVRELMRADLAVLNQGQRNAVDAISMLQVAEEALNIIDDLLVRTSQLAEQASTGSYSSQQRNIMNAEFNQLIAEIDRIASSTTFNGQNLLNYIGLIDDPDKYEMHIGQSSTVDVERADMTARGLGLMAIATSADIRIGAVDPNDTSWFSPGGSNLWFDFSGGQTVNVIPTPWNYSMTQTIAIFNAASNAIDSDWDMASLIYDGQAQRYFLKIQAQTGGSQTVSSNLPLINRVMGSEGLSLATAAEARDAVVEIRNIIEAKNTYRAYLGYSMNRFEAASDVIGIQAENILAAESRISDADIAAEMSTLTRNQILTQAGVAMLAQANTIPQMALSLLQ